MGALSRRQAIGAVVAGSAVAIGAKPPAAAKDDRPAKLIEAMEGFRTTMPPARGLSEQNGMSWKEIEPYIATHLGGVAKRLGVKTQAECLVMLTYLKDPDGKLRYIACQAIESVVNAYPHGMSVEFFADTKSNGHHEMTLRFVERIGKLPG